jgi:ribosomal protein L30/L7E
VRGINQVCVCVILESNHFILLTQQVHPRIRQVMQLFGLLHVNDGVFVKLNKASLKMLRFIEPYVIWGLVMFYFIYKNLMFLVCVYLIEIDLPQKKCFYMYVLTEIFIIFLNQY